jgi:hypothetical protein
MSLAIEFDYVKSVLLADGWHDVDENSFYLDAYEFVWGVDPEGKPNVIHPAGSDGLSTKGFAFIDDEGTRIFGPISSIIAVRY